MLLVPVFISTYDASPSAQTAEAVRISLKAKEPYAKELIKLTTRSGVTQKFVLSTPKDAKASIILFSGSGESWL